LFLLVFLVDDGAAGIESGRKRKNPFYLHSPLLILPDPTMRGAAYFIGRRRID
jgi:hypothetical protein